MSRSVMFVDSTASFRESIAEHLNGLGCRVIQAESGVDATSKLSDANLDVVVVDHMLSDQPGVELIRSIRESNRELPMILLVDPVFDSRFGRDLELQVGRLLVVRGPVRGEVLLRHIETLLEAVQTNSLPNGSPESAEDIAPLETPSRVPDGPSISDQLDAVRQIYKKKLPSELKELERSLDKVHHSPMDKAAMREALRIAHTIYGTAGTFGFTEVSIAAGEIQECLKRLLSGHVSFEEVWESISIAADVVFKTQVRPSIVEAGESKVIGVARILLVGDDMDLTTSLQALAKKNLVSIVPASSSGQAIDVMNTQRLDGVIMDISAQNQDRLTTLTAKIRALEGCRDLPIAVMSKDNTVENRVAATHAGASHFLQKPINADELMDTVRAFSAVRREVDTKILIVDDDEVFAEHVAVILKGEGMNVSTLCEPMNVLDAMEHVKPDILLLDVHMPQIGGFDLCRMLRSSSEWKNLPILFLTADSDSKGRIKCFEAGGDDYIEKPVIKEELLARIGVRQERIRMFRERAEQDSLTNLPNRRAFLELFKVRVQEGQRSGRPLSLCLIDLDNFKNVNDTFGHLAGDRVLLRFGRLLSSRFRTIDIRGRWGGEEFAVAFCGENARTGKLILDRVLTEFKCMAFDGDDGQKFHASFSSGIATFPDDGDTFDELFHVADGRLYRAKENGRSRIEI